MNRYEAMVILPESLTEDEIEQGLDRLNAAIKALGGQASKASRMGRKAFARPMHKQTVGEYALLRLELDGDKIAELQSVLKLDDAIFRIQFTRLADAATA
ncbi:30S ribosomal protein S6 [Kiritimatiellaeota bacterium B1221]|nr:30S ribosomal protein S6 [Kiritimatiellaeota bacterium B1221]